MAFESEVKDYEATRDALKALLASNPTFVTELIKMIKLYNTVTKDIQGKVYDTSKESGKQVYAGPFGAKTGSKEEYDLYALEDVLPIKEFKKVVEITYVLRDEGKPILNELAKTNPKVLEHIHKVPGSTIKSGPKPIDGVGELESLA